MGNCRGAPSALGSGGKNRRIPSANPYTVAYNRGAGPPARAGLVVPRDPTSRDLDDKYVLGEELFRGEFGVTYLCTEAAMGTRTACKSISNYKLTCAVRWRSCATCSHTQTSSVSALRGRRALQQDHRAGPLHRARRPRSPPHHRRRVPGSLDAHCQRCVMCLHLSILCYWTYG